VYGCFTDNRKDNKYANKLEHTQRVQTSS